LSLVAAYFAARLLGLRRIAGSMETSKRQQRYRKESHDVSLGVETENI
jgi:hypothetical protein